MLPGRGAEAPSPKKIARGLIFPQRADPERVPTTIRRGLHRLIRGH